MLLERMQPSEYTMIHSSRAGNAQVSSEGWLFRLCFPGSMAGQEVRG